MEQGGGVMGALKLAAQSVAFSVLSLQVHRPGSFLRLPPSGAVRASLFLGFVQLDV